MARRCSCMRARGKHTTPTIKETENAQLLAQLLPVLSLTTTTQPLLLLLLLLLLLAVAVVVAVVAVAVAAVLLLLLVLPQRVLPSSWRGWRASE